MKDITFTKSCLFSIVFINLVLYDRSNTVHSCYAPVWCLKVMSIQKKSSFSLASFLEKLPGDFFSHTEVPTHTGSLAVIWAVSAACAVIAVYRRRQTTTATCQITVMRQTEGEMHWLNLALCSLARYLNSEEVSATLPASYFVALVTLFQFENSVLMSGYLLFGVCVYFRRKN